MFKARYHYPHAHEHEQQQRKTTTTPQKRAFVMSDTPPTSPDEPIFGDEQQQPTSKRLLPPPIGHVLSADGGESMLSDLTENRTYKRFLAQQGLARNSKNDAAAPTSGHNNNAIPSPSAVMQHRVKSAGGAATSTIPTRTTHDDDDDPPIYSQSSFMYKVLSSMEHACGTDNTAAAHQVQVVAAAAASSCGAPRRAQNRVAQVKVPEWGVAPVDSVDDDEDDTTTTGHDDRGTLTVTAQRRLREEEAYQNDYTDAYTNSLMLSAARGQKRRHVPHADDAGGPLISAGMPDNAAAVITAPVGTAQHDQLVAVAAMARSGACSLVDGVVEDDDDDDEEEEDAETLSEMAREDFEMILDEHKLDHRRGTLSTPLRNDKKAGKFTKNGWRRKISFRRNKTGTSESFEEQPPSTFKTSFTTPFPKMKRANSDKHSTLSAAPPPRSSSRSQQLPSSLPPAPRRRVPPSLPVGVATPPPRRRVPSSPVDPIQVIDPDDATNEAALLGLVMPAALPPRPQNEYDAPRVAVTTPAVHTTPPATSQAAPVPDEDDGFEDVPDDEQEEEEIVAAQSQEVKYESTPMHFKPTTIKRTKRRVRPKMVGQVLLQKVRSLQASVDNMRAHHGNTKRSSTFPHQKSASVIIAEPSDAPLYGKPVNNNNAAGRTPQKPATPRPSPVLTATAAQFSEPAAAVVAAATKPAAPESKAARKEALLKRALANLKNAKLSTIRESDENNNNNELQVRVPGSKNTLGSDDMIGDEVVDESATADDSHDIKTVEESMDPQSWGATTISTDTYPLTPDSPYHHATAVTPTSTFQKPPTAEAAAPTSDPVVDADFNSSPAVARKSSWKDMLRVKRSGSHNSAAAVNSEGPDARRQRSGGGGGPTTKNAARTIKTAAIDAEDPIGASPPPGARKKKGQWKSALDANTGRTYYYHRLTRKTTWTKPAEEELYVKVGAGGGGGNRGKQRDAEEEKKEEEATPMDPEGATAAETGVGGAEALEPSSIWSIKEQISNLIGTMPDLQDMDRLMAQYDGRESELLGQLKVMKKEFPFDEPDPENSAAAADVKQADTSHKIHNAEGLRSIEPSLAAASLKSRTRTTATTVSGFSGRTEKTQPIRNTRASKRISPIQESGQSYSSDERDQGEQPASSATDRVRRVPSKIVHRQRELYVEDLSIDRVKARTYDASRSRATRTRLALEYARAQSAMPAVSSTPQHDVSKPIVPDPVPLEDMEASRRTESSAHADSVSAITDDVESSPVRGGKEGMDRARRRALNDAISRGDWDLAAALSEGMRTLNSKAGQRLNEPKEWTQSELDRYISENDWDAVANYIAHVRDAGSNAKRGRSGIPRPPQSTSRRLLDDYVRQQQTSNRGNSDSSSSNPQKKFGARSQLQHTDLNSVSSWESYSSFESNYTSESYDTDEDKGYRRGRRQQPAVARGRAKEFAC